MHALLISLGLPTSNGRSPLSRHRRRCRILNLRNAGDGGCGNWRRPRQVGEVTAQVEALDDGRVDPFS